MYLKRLELKGFKSFPVKTDIIFKEGITAIVGPNGSGKSNISDAVRWVLGEQSIKSLRGDKLEDVIFAGTDTKKPMNYCEVALTIDNSENQLELDFTEVTIRRRAYRNGESEFFLNNKSCRLKDIKEVFLDTGIGKDGYSIIEQGKVDEILSNNPLSRRKVFDEACGISKYRYKKQEAERNLSNTKENLERIDDVYIEIENQLKPLFNQQTKAKKYLEISEKLKTLEVNSFIREIEGIEKELSEVNEHRKVIEKELNEKEEQKNVVEKKQEDINKEVEVLQDVIEKSVDYINSIKGVISKKESQINLIKERIRNFTNEISRKNLEIKDIKEKLNENKQYIKELESNKLSGSEELSTLQENIKVLESSKDKQKIKLESLNNEIELLKESIIDILNKKQEFSNKLSTLNANKENMNIRDENINSEITELNKNIEIKSSELDTINKEFNMQNENLKNVNNRHKELSINLQDSISEHNKLEDEIQKSKYNLNGYNSKLNVYIDMENHYEGFNRGVKEVLKNKNLKGVHGALGQIINVPEKYEKSIEAALGAYMQNIITDNEFSAKSAINYLKQNNLGRVTFLPLNIIKSNKISLGNLKANTKFIGIASDLITFDEKYRNIIENILGRTILINNMDEGIKFAKETGHRFKIVTLDGEILNPGGSLTGGSLKTNGNILSRKRYINEYTEKISNIKNEISHLELKRESLDKDVKNIKNEIDSHESKIKDLEKSIIIKSTSIKNVESEIESLKGSITKLENEKNDLNSNLNYTLEKSDDVRKDMEELDDLYNKNKEKIDALNEEIKRYNDLYDKEKSEFDELNLSLVKKTEVYNSIVRDIKRISGENCELEEKNKQLEESLNYEEHEIIKLQDSILTEEKEKENLTKQLGDSNRNLETRKIAKDDLKNSFDEINKELKTIDRQHIELKESLFKVGGRLERLKTSQDTYINKLFEQYDMTLVQALEIKDEDLDIDRKFLESLKREIRSLGNINIDSIKEYEEIKERYDFYSEQKQDLEESMEEIEKLIHTLEENMKSEFEIKFEEISKNFKYVYKRLFGGGCGELTILDKENLLESDILITAQPPGKKMKNLNLLSGGEKALTAISILFAILITKPTPFCILDEIEAPLDDANIFRFGEFLKDLSKETQFISVTHRRGTMEAADYIYGVTMQEKAISKVISLKLKEAQEITDII